jgi:hypothetical protein
VRQAIMGCRALVLASDKVLFYRTTARHTELMAIKGARVSSPPPPTTTTTAAPCTSRQHPRPQVPGPPQADSHPKRTSR